MSKRRRRKCRNCGQLFRPDPRNVRHQRFCSATACRRASKADSQRRWLSSPANRDYFRGPENVERVRAWREVHPGYWRRGREPAGTALQDDSLAQAVDSIEESDPLSNRALQELSDAQPLVLLGLIAHLTGAALQEDIVESTRRLHALGHDLLAARGADAVAAARSPPQPPGDRP